MFFKIFIVGIGSNLNISPRRGKKRNKNTIDAYFYSVGQHFWRSMGCIYHTQNEETQDEIIKQIIEICPENQSKIIAQKLGAYDKILPGAAERILRMAEKEQEVSNKIDIKLTKYVGRGQLFGFVLGLVTIIGGILLIYVGKDIGGLTSLLSGLGALLWAYLHGQKESTESEE